MKFVHLGLLILCHTFEKSATQYVRTEEGTTAAPAIPELDIRVETEEGTTVAPAIPELDVAAEDNTDLPLVVSALDVVAQDNTDLQLDVPALEAEAEGITDLPTVHNTTSTLEDYPTGLHTSDDNIAALPSDFYTDYGYGVLDDYNYKPNYYYSNYNELHGAAQHGMDEEVVKLLEEDKYSVNVRDSWDWTPLHYASWWGQDSTVDILLTYGADVKARTFKGYGSAGNTPLHHAAHRIDLSTAVMQTLLKADPSVQYIRNWDDQLPIDMALAAVKRIFDEHSENLVAPPLEGDIVYDTAFYDSGDFYPDHHFYPDYPEDYAVDNNQTAYDDLPTAYDYIPIPSDTASYDLPTAADTDSDDIPIPSDTASYDIPTAYDYIPIPSDTASYDIPTASDTDSDDIPIDSDSASHDIPIVTEASLEGFLYPRQK